MGWKPKDSPSFFKFLLNRPDFADNLPIPPCFVTKYLEQGKTKNNSMLVTNESVEPWPVTMVDIGGRYCFKLGWPEFVQDNNLETGDFLLFWLIRRFTFLVAIYSPSGIEKKNASSSATNYIKYKNGKVEEEEEEEEENCMHQAATFVKPLQNPFFIVTINRRSSMNRLYVPKWFLRETKLLGTRSMMLRDIAGNEWPAKISPRKSSNGYHLSSGWLTFREANEIEHGDTCLLRFLQGNVIDVEVLNRKGSRTQKQGRYKTTAASSVKQLQHTLSFKATLGRSSNNRMGIPIWFARASGLASRRSVILKDEMGCAYLVWIRPRYNFGYDLATGWSSLRKANNIEKGDTCLFRLSREQSNVLHVKLIQKKVKRVRRMTKIKTDSTSI